MKKQAQERSTRTNLSKSETAAPELPSDEQTNVEQVIELNRKFAKAILEVGQTYLNAMSDMQTGLLQTKSAHTENSQLAPATTSKPISVDVSNSPRDRLTSLDDPTNEVSTAVSMSMDPAHYHQDRIKLAWENNLSAQYLEEAERLIKLAQKVSQGKWSPVLTNDLTTEDTTKYEN